MAIVTISRIQHRRGLYENLPTLAAAELGWAADQRRLFIGNGPVSEGAPEVGTTEILTEFSDLLSVAQTYTFKNANTNFVPSTGPSANAPVIRTLQKKLDDFASVLDFGAKGDGSTDDTDSINRAMYELYCKETFPGTKKALYFPAGHYVISGYLKIPPQASLIGEGPYSTIIEQTGNPNTYTSVFATADSKQQIEGSLGTNGATLPSDILISDMGLLCNRDGINIEKCPRITLNRVRITGPESYPAIASTSGLTGDTPYSIGVKIRGTTVSPSEDINLVDCYINKMIYGVWQDASNQFFQNMMISSGTFQELYEGIFISVNNGSAKNISVTGTVFNNVYARAIEVGNVQNFTSSFNYYREVGNANLGAGSPLISIIKFGLLTNHSASLGDLFDRPDADDLAFPRVETTNVNTSFFEYGHALGIGYHIRENGKEDTLADATTGGSTSATFNLTRYRHAQLRYNIYRNHVNRSGTLNITFDSNAGTYMIDDDSNETGDVGVTFDINISSGIATLTYTTTGTGFGATFRYSVARLNNVV